jgi:spermidine synthase
VLLLLGMSGAAALVYEIVWLELMQLVVGSSAVSLGMLLATFMGGTCLGSLGFDRYAPRRRHPLVIYGVIEVSIAALGVLVLLMMPWVGRAYVATVAAGLSGTVARSIVPAICLLPPTLLMGATLPSVVRSFGGMPSKFRWTGFAYAANVAGAVAGCVLAGFYVLPTYDVRVATAVAAALNIAAAAGAFLLAKGAPAFEIRREDVAGGDGRRDSWPAYAIVALSGCAALAAEVLWTRSLSLLLGGTVYTFSLVLAVFLAAMAVGSFGGSRFVRRQQPALVALGICQLLLIPALAWTTAMLTVWLPYWPINPALSEDPWISLQIDIIRCLAAIVPPAVLWGATFPLAVAAAGAASSRASAIVGRILAANTAGAIVGATAASLIVIPMFGTHAGAQMLLGLSAAAAVAALGWSVRRERATVAGGTAIGLAAVVLITAWTAVRIPEQPAHLVAYGRHMITWLKQVRVIYVGEGLNASVAVSEFADGVRNFHVSGKVEASTQPQDMRLQRMLAHIPALAHDDPRSVLVVGLGAGVTAGSFAHYGTIGRITIAEIEPLIPAVVSQYFTAQNNNIVHDSRVQLVSDDGRHYLQTTSEQFDIITSDPIHPWVKGSANLYTREYFELVRQHLRPGGMVTQWLPLYESGTDAVKMAMATFFDVFPGGTVWANAQGPNAIDVVLLGQVSPTPIDADRMEARLAQSPYVGVRNSLNEIGFNSAADLLSTFAGRSEDLRSWLGGVELNRDRSLRLQYLAGRESNIYASGRIYDELLAFRHFTDATFRASDAMKAALTERATQRAASRLEGGPRPE